MDNSLQRSSPLRKTSYFEKYRKELERISEEMRSKNQSNSFSEKSDSKNPSKSSSNSEQKLSTSYHPSPTPSPLPLKASVKKSPVFEAQREPAKVLEIKQEPEQHKEGEEEMRQVQLLVGELQAARGKLARCEEEIAIKRNSLETLKKELARESAVSSNAELQNYAEKMLAIETRMKFKKELHEDELNRLVNERNQRHAENVQLSKLIESLEEELQALATEQRKSLQPTTALQLQADRLQSDISRLTQECAEVELRINNSEQLRQLSNAQYRRYCEVYMRDLLGREVAQTEQRIRERNNEKRFLKETERKKMLIKERRVDNCVRQKTLTELTKVIDFVTKEIAILRKELNVATDKGMFYK